MHTMATRLFGSRPMVGTVLYIGNGSLSPQRHTEAKWIPRLPCIPSGSESVRSGVDNGYHVSLVPLLLHVRARFRTLPKCRRWGDKCGFLYREMHPNRHCGSHGRSLSVPALQVLRWRYWELRVLFDLPELVCGTLVYVLWHWDVGATQAFVMPF